MVSDFDLSCEFFDEVLLSVKFVLELVDNVLVLLASLVSTSDFMSPLVLIDQLSILSHETCVDGTVWIVLVDVFLKEVCLFDALLVSAKHVCG